MDGIPFSAEHFYGLLPNIFALPNGDCFPPSILKIFFGEILILLKRFSCVLNNCFRDDLTERIFHRPKRINSVPINFGFIPFCDIIENSFWSRAAGEGYIYWPFFVCPKTSKRIFANFSESSSLLLDTSIYNSQ
jgi:hypothetical protein